MPEFTTTLVAASGNNVGIVVPDDIVFGFGRGKRVPVTVQINGDYTYRNTIASMAGQFLISFNSETREATGKGAGDEITVQLELDEEPRTVEVPEPLAVLLSAEPELADAWNGLSYSKQRGHVDPIIAARGEDTRTRRVEKVIKALRSE
ncbi:YdeI/OmpD-associated family protein [Glutamicibacter sp.]|uniref:YdeI/OmpD-associated family protein n=1 Tax=Glutamicibacter sp. TaxID=1931995 RepID=UPI002B4A9889|nr:YdeI/OmpD-associated family protein [Glutamicibacter sp.]HJX78484.1 YdeI/OmpD-associated family protein [Glutamicibacter sp.]